MLVSLLRAIKPQMLESFKDQNAQKEFVKKLLDNKNLLVILKDNKNIITKVENNNINNFLKHDGKIAIYSFQRKAIQVK